ncbi:transmembrane protein 131 isoform X2 [Phymastichus coffea]|uniref:transmembrane protein 131 isoform X2 n=1 Tax=Phymastichus coffea TaxID=108790 RepID=UPI00273C9C29|nr:transmembrane protein 131 isoform X2 [Phymastichus coffea]
MIDIKLCRSLFLFTLLASITQIQPSLHGHNNAFVQDDDIQYLLENLPLSMHKGFTNSVHGPGDPLSEENIQDSIPHIEFEPNILDFKERQLGIPHQETVTLFNRDDNKTIHLSSISGNTQHFHSSFFQDKVIPPLGNTTFNVVFLGREEGEIDSYLFIHTSDGTIKYQVKGVSVSSPYRLRPVVGVKLPINASFTPLIYIHNPHSEPMQVVEVYSSGREFQLELPSGEIEGPRELWEIPPYQTKPVIRLYFNAYIEKNYTAYIRFRVNNSAEILIVAVEIEVGSGAGLHWGGSSAIVNFGMGGSNQPPIRYQISLKNSAKKPVKVQNIISTPTSKALRINFEPTVIPGETDVPVAVGTLTYDWKTGLDLKHFKGKLLIKGIGPGGSSQKLAIPWIAEVLQGGLEVNTSAAHYCSPQSSQPRNFSVVNKFKLPLAITNISLPFEASPLFTISNFVPKILKSGQRDNIFTLSLTHDKKSENLQLESLILIHSNVSTTEVPLLSYNGKLKKIIPEERESDEGSMNFGTVSSGIESEGIFALENHNPISIELHGWGVNMPGAVLELMGCQNGPTDLFHKSVRNISACSVTGNQSIKPDHLAIFKIKVKTPFVEEDTIVGDVFVRTTYERLIVPVHMKVAHGKLSVKKLTFTECFPGSICLQSLKVHSTFARPMEVTFIAPLHKDEKIKYVPLDIASSAVISKGDNHIGSILIDPSITCKQRCYLGLSLNSSLGSQWLNTLNLPSHTRDSDLNILNNRYTRYLNTSNGLWDNVTMQLDTSEVRGHRFSVNIKPYWPSLLVGNQNWKNKSLLSFPLTQVGNVSYKIITLHNPTMYPLVVHLVMDWSYPQGNRLFHSLPNKFKPVCAECPTSVHSEFKLDNALNDKSSFERKWRISAASHTLPTVLKANETKTIRLSYTPSAAAPSSALLYIRNNMTILEIVRLVGRGAYAQFKFGNRKPGSPVPLSFELTEKHLKDCDAGQWSEKSPSPNLTVKRSFMARNTGELPIAVRGFYISGLSCEGYGFRVLNCASFRLEPNATRKIEIAFTPDFTLSRVERSLLIRTSLGPEISENTELLNQERGLVKLNLVASLPAHMLEVCASMLARPSWESSLQSTATVLTLVLLVCSLVAAFIEADRILRGALVNLSRGNPTQPPLDLRSLSHQHTLSMPHQSYQSSNSNNHQHCKDKLAALLHNDNSTKSNVNSAKIGKKEDNLLDWTSLVYAKNSKDEDMHKNIKISDWSLEEERKFRIDAEAKDTPLSKCCLASDTLAFEPITNNQNPVPTKKRNNKRQNVQETHVENSSTTTEPSSSVPDTQVIAKKTSPSTKSSPTSYRKGKSCKKDTLKLVTHEVQIDRVNSSASSVSKDATVKCEGNKRKRSTGTNGAASNSNNLYKKYEANAGQKVTQYSEEETSSTTTESSVQDDNNTYKECESTYDKTDKAQKKSSTTKLKPQNNSAVPSLDYKDSYEGDCDDDDYDKDKQDNSNKWKTSTNRSTSKSQMSRLAMESNKLPRPKQNPPRKEKVTLKRRSAEKSQPKVLVPVTNENSCQKEETKSPPVLSSVSVPVSSPPTAAAPPPLVCWGENRAKFSDVVARNQDNLSQMFSNYDSCKTQRANSPGVAGSFGGDNSDCTKHQFMQDKTLNDYKFNGKPIGTPVEQEGSSNRTDRLSLHSNNHLHSYFANTFNDTKYDCELVPYTDLPDTDEPLVELESTEENANCKLWHHNNLLLELMPANTSFQLPDPPITTEKIPPLLDTLKDNWVTVETNWEPLYTRGAVGEERSGVWGINTGGVWSAAPWGAPTRPPTLQPTSQSRDQNIQERSDFDPFRSLSTIWTPSSSDTWTSKHK